MQSGRIYAQATWVRRIDEKESGLWRTPANKEPGIDVERLQTKEGEAAKIGERAYDKETGRLAQVGLPQQVKMWPTPQGQEGFNRRRSMGIRSDGLETKVKMIPTPRASDGAGKSSHGRTWSTTDFNLHSYVRMWPTPNASDWKNRGTEEYREGRQVQLQTQVGGQLNPTWVEWLMGFPLGWTDSSVSVTPLSLKSQSFYSGG
jgi:hypothetical protein